MVSTCSNMYPPTTKSNAAPTRPKPRLSISYTTYVVDFHLRHLNRGVRGPTFDPVRSALITKYDRSLRPQMVTTPSTTVFLGNRAFLSSLLNSFAGLGIARRLGRFAARRRSQGDS
jgi:hypothetical protein